MVAGEREEPDVMRRMRGSVSGVPFRVIQVALVPVGTIGYLWAVPKLLVFSRRMRVSATLFAWTRKPTSGETSSNGPSTS